MPRAARGRLGSGWPSGPLARLGRVLVLPALLAAAASGCLGDRPRVPQKQVAGGDPEAGRRHLAQMACRSCHDIPGVRGADGTVGPPLHRFARRSFIAGAVPNEGESLVRWILDPSSIEPGTAIPDLGLEESDARDIAAYLYTLE